jgi:thiamine transport system ATP-binding protein
VTATGASLELDEVTVRFPGAPDPALDRVALSVAPGEVVALLGPSGCGKTTLLRAVAGLTPPTAGRVLLDGADLAGVAAHRRGVGLMFQDHALFPHRDIGGNVEFGLRMAGVDAAHRRARVGEVLELVGLGGWETRAVGPLSGGERQRVALARALAPSPRLLLLDEPLGALDRTLRDRLVAELAGLFRDLGLTVVHVTHDQAEALALADRVAVMDAGRIVQTGPPGEVWSRPATGFVARFLGFTNVGPDGEGRRLVRPEAVRLSTPHDGSAAAAARVEAVLFKGDHSLVTVRTDDGALLEAKVPTGSAAWKVGDRVAVRIDPAGVQHLRS